MFQIGASGILRTDTAEKGDIAGRGDMEAAPALAGQSVGLIDGVKTAQEIIDETLRAKEATA